MVYSLLGSSSPSFRALVKFKNYRWILLTLMKLTVCGILAFVIVSATGLSSAHHAGGDSRASLRYPNRTFKVDYKANEFRKDGQLFRYIAGEMHYFRVPRASWRDRMRKFRAAGLNALSTYVHWYAHEPQPNEFDFSGQNDLEHYIELAAEEGLFVLLRPGPFICAEIDFGGFPPWLLSIDPNMNLRSSDPVYKAWVNHWYSKLMPMMRKHLYGNGGPIIMVQVENEFGSYTCDRQYMAWLAELTESFVQGAALLYTTDGGNDHFFKCGPTPGVFATVDFVPRSNAMGFGPMQRYNEGGPNVNSEYYTGWLSHWAEHPSQVAVPAIAESLMDMLSKNASVSMYMFHGGTNFGFSSGANYLDVSLANLNGKFQPDLTSYDYDSPLNEAGDPRAKYFAIQNILKQHARKYNLTFLDIPVRKSPKKSYGAVKLNPVKSIFDERSPAHVGMAMESERPLKFEEMGIYQGHVLYETRLLPGLGPSLNLSVGEIRDHAFVYVNQEYKGLLSRLNDTFSTRFNINGKTKGNEILSIFVENLGHINYGKRIVGDVKGIVGPVKINGYELRYWRMYNHNMTNILDIQEEPIREVKDYRFKTPTYFTKDFVISDVEPKDTFLDTSGWGKGVAFINGINLGRYWPLVGPQATLYVPASYLRPSPETNRITLFELFQAPANLSIFFVDAPNLNALRVPDPKT